MSCPFAAEIGDRWAETGSLVIIIGETKSLSVKDPTQVKIGNPQLLDVVGAGQTELLLSGLKEGETILTITDAYGERQYGVQVFAEDLEKVKERVEVLLGAAGYDTVKTSIGYKERKVFLTGELPQSEKENFETKIEPVREKVVNLVSYQEPLSVEIDVEVLEIGKTDLDNLGITWTQSVELTRNNRATGIDGFLDPMHFMNILDDGKATTSLTATLNILKQNNKARTLSRPKLVCLSGKEAKLHVGGERPILTSASTSSEGATTTVSASIEMKEYGIILLIKPTIKDDNEIVLGLSTEITEVDTSNALSITGVGETPGFTKRLAETELTIMDGQTIFLAGLIKSLRNDNRDAVPGFEKIPFLGALFRNRDVQQRDTEVVITLTPTILRKQQVRSLPAVGSSRNAAGAVSSSGTATQRRPETFSEKDKVIQSYSQLVQNIIHSNISYPAEFREKNIRGTVKLSLHLQSSGRLLGVVIMHSSGNAALDELAELTVKKLSPFPSFPSELKLDELWIDMPIVYNLGDRV